VSIHNAKHHFKRCHIVDAVITNQIGELLLRFFRDAIIDSGLLFVPITRLRSGPRACAAASISLCHVSPQYSSFLRIFMPAKIEKGPSLSKQP
jgi:hypothetical protein